MRELVLFLLENTRYGIWRDQILSVQSVQSLHRLPFARSSLTVLSVFGGQTQTLADLPLCLGHPATMDAKGTNAWILSERESIRGFLVSGESLSVQAPEALIPAPDFLRALPIEGFFNHDSLPVPVINVPALYERVRKAERERQAPPLALNIRSVDQSRAAAGFRVFDSAGSLFAAAGAGIAEATVSGRWIARIPLLPPNITGVALSHGRILPVVDLALRVSGKKSPDNARILEATLNDTTLGFLVDEDEGEWAAEDVLVKDLPPVLRAPWMGWAVLRGAHIAPVIELGAVLSSPAGSEGGSSRAGPPDSRFPAMFGRQAVEVVEFAALGTVFAVPQSEVIDILPCQPFQELPMAAGLVAGLADFGGELVPVLDLARIGGELPQRTADWRMIVLKNGDFSALLMCESARAGRTLDRDVQRGVPVVLSFPVVYGCYTDAESVRLVLNIEELTVHYHQADAALLLPALAMAAGEKGVRARAAPDAQEPPHPPITASEPALPTESVTEITEEPAPELPASAEHAEPSLPAEMVVTSLEPSVAEPQPVELQPVEPSVVDALPVEPLPVEAQPAEPAPALPVSEVEQVAMIESAPSIGDEDILEPVHPAAAWVVPPPAPVAAESARTIQTQGAPSGTLASAKPERSAPAPRRAGRYVLVAAVIAILLGACVVAGLHFGILRSRPAETSAPAAVPATAQPAAAPVPTKQETTTSAESASHSADTQYVVKEGDTLWDIAARFTGNAHNYPGLAANNGIVNPNLISPGQVIKLPR
jgi:chemotaxis signal transduction protein